MVKIINDVKSLRAEVEKRKDSGDSIGLVPTMGYLHEGHLSLVDLMRDKSDVVIVSIFVNPTQFGENEDLGNYPRDVDGDIAKLDMADIVYIPQVEDMYPEGLLSNVKANAELSSGLCGANRPGHFDGVVTVVSKLLEHTSADFAVFGEKDYQQLQIIRRMVVDLNFDVEVIGSPIVRESDGLAMSSRNSYLNVQQRKIAPKLYSVLQDVSCGLYSLQDAKERLLGFGFSGVDYIELVDAESLQPIFELSNSARLIAAARLGNTRLIDNIAVEMDKYNE